jgi:molybdopterin converting factor small subunit
MAELPIQLLKQIMNIKIESFGAIQRLLPEQLSLQHTVESSIDDVLAQVIRLYPDAHHLLERCACAIGEDIVCRDKILLKDTVIVLLSPVAGG